MLASTAVGETVDGSFWQDLSNHRLDFFDVGNQPLWRLSLPEGVSALSLPGETVYEWGGCLRWYRGSADAEAIHHACESVGGYAFCSVNAKSAAERFPRMDQPRLHWHQRLLDAFDPDRVFNPGMAYPETWNAD